MGHGESHGGLSAHHPHAASDTTTVGFSLLLIAAPRRTLPATRRHRPLTMYRFHGRTATRPFAGSSLAP